LGIFRRLKKCFWMERNVNLEERPGGKLTIVSPPFAARRASSSSATTSGKLSQPAACPAADATSTPMSATTTGLWP
jgi:hypothetical protein